MCEVFVGLTVFLIRVVKDEVIFNLCHPGDPDEAEAAMRLLGLLRSHRKVSDHGFRGEKSGEVTVFANFSSIDEAMQFLKDSGLEPRIVVEDLLAYEAA